jgi:effector-binding domain-containing protein
MTYNCELKEQAAQPTLTIRTRIPVQNIPQFMGKAFGGVMQYLEEQGEQPAGPPFAAYYNMDMQNMDVEAGFPVSRSLAGRGELQAGTIPGGKRATCLHVGPYEQLGLAYEALTEWIKANGYEPTGVAYEFYLNAPDDTPPQGLQTLMVFPLK